MGLCCVWSTCVKNHFRTTLWQIDVRGQLYLSKQEQAITWRCAKCCYNSLELFDWFASFNSCNTETKYGIFLCYSKSVTNFKVHLPKLTVNRYPFPTLWKLVSFKQRRPSLWTHFARLTARFIVNLFPASEPLLFRGLLTRLRYPLTRRVIVRKLLWAVAEPLNYPKYVLPQSECIKMGLICCGNMNISFRLDLNTG